MPKGPGVLHTCTQVFAGHTHVLPSFQCHTKVLLPSWRFTWFWFHSLGADHGWFSNWASLWAARGNQSWGSEEVLARSSLQKHKQKLASMMFATVYQGKRGKEFGKKVEETGLHLVTGLSTLGKRNFVPQCVKSQRRCRLLTLPHAKMKCLSFPLFCPHMCTPLPPDMSSAFGLGKANRGIFS